MKMKIGIKKSNILPFLAVGTLFYSLFPIYIWGTAMAANSRTIAVCLGTAYILTNINIIKCKKYESTNNFLTTYYLKCNIYGRVNVKASRRGIPPRVWFFVVLFLI